MCNLTNDPVGRPIVASVGEPWDFESDAGKNRLEGKVTAVGKANEPAGWCLCTVSGFRVQSVLVTTIAIVNRYKEDVALPERLARGEKVIANFLYDPSGADLSEVRLREALAQKTGLGLLVGSVQVVTGSKAESSA